MCISIWTACKDSAASQKKDNLCSFRSCSPEHSLIQQLYLDRAESRLQAPYSNTNAAARKGARGAPDPRVSRSLPAATRKESPGCPALADGLSLCKSIWLRVERPAPAGAALPARGAEHRALQPGASRGGVSVCPGGHLTKAQLTLQSGPLPRDPRGSADPRRKALPPQAGTPQECCEESLRTRHKGEPGRPEPCSCHAPASSHPGNSPAEPPPPPLPGHAANTSPGKAA